MRITGCVLACAIAIGVPDTISAQAAPILRVTRDLRIDATEHDLSAVGWIAVSPNGTIAVAQRQDGVIRFFDANGRPSGTFGRKGQGPGEFELVGRASWIADTLVVNDILRRHTFISPDQKLVRVRSWVPAITQQTGAAVPQFSFFVPWAIYSNGDQLLGTSLRTGGPVPDLPGAIQNGTAWLRVDSSGAIKSVIAWLEQENCQVPIQEGRGVAGIPYCATTRHDVSSDGDRLAFARASSVGRAAYDVVVIRATGDTVFRRSYTYRPIPITKSERERAITAAAQFPGSREALEKVRFPEHRPPVARILLARDENTWIEVTTVTADRSWQVLDVQGNVVGRVALKRNVYPMAIARGLMWAIETDEDGLEHIVRYRIGR